MYELYKILRCYGQSVLFYIQLREIIHFKYIIRYINALHLQKLFLIKKKLVKKEKKKKKHFFFVLFPF
jgi:hypothetical protein